MGWYGPRNAGCCEGGRADCFSVGGSGQCAFPQNVIPTIFRLDLGLRSWQSYRANCADNTQCEAQTVLTCDQVWGEVDLWFDGAYYSSAGSSRGCRWINFFPFLIANPCVPLYGSTCFAVSNVAFALEIQDRGGGLRYWLSVALTGTCAGSNQSTELCTHVAVITYVSDPIIANCLSPTRGGVIPLYKFSQVLSNPPPCNGALPIQVAIWPL